MYAIQFNFIERRVVISNCLFIMIMMSIAMNHCATEAHLIEVVSIDPLVADANVNV